MVAFGNVLGSRGSVIPTFGTEDVRNTEHPKVLRAINEQLDAERTNPRTRAEPGAGGD